jgi:hypothetical protein
LTNIVYKLKTILKFRYIKKNIIVAGYRTKRTILHFYNSILSEWYKPMYWCKSTPSFCQKKKKYSIIILCTIIICIYIYVCLHHSNKQIAITKSSDPNTLMDNERKHINKVIWSGNKIPPTCNNLWIATKYMTPT